MTVFFLFFIVSCASINNGIKSTPFAGKVLINQNNVEQYSFNININVASNISIIQLKKPFYGNVLEIKVQDGKNLIFLPTESSQPFIVPKSVNRNFKYWIRQCVYAKNFEKYDPVNPLYFKCFKEKNKTTFFIRFSDVEISGYIKRK